MVPAYVVYTGQISFDRQLALVAGQLKLQPMDVGAGQGRPERSSQAALYPRTETPVGLPDLKVWLALACPDLSHHGSCCSARHRASSAGGRTAASNRA